MAQTLGALQISKCASSCLHERTSTSKKEDCPETQSTKSTKNTSLEPPSPTFIFWACKKNMVSFDILSTKLAFCSRMPFVPFPPFPSTNLSDLPPWHCVGQLVLDGKRSQQNCLIRQCCWLGFLRPIAIDRSAIGLSGGWLIVLLGWLDGWLVGWLDGWLVEEHYNYTWVRWWPRLLEWMLLVFSQLLCR